MGIADRAINMALRITGMGELERDWKRAGDAGSKSFAQVERSANGAAREVSEYTERLRRAAAVAKIQAANTPDLWKGPQAQQIANRRDFMLGAINAEKQRILSGAPDTIRDLQQLEQAGTGVAASFRGMGPAGAIAGAALAALGVGVQKSLEAFMDHERALEKFRAEMALAGNKSGETANQIAASAQRIVASNLQTEQSALEGAQTLAAVAGLNKQSFEEALKASADYADAVGKDLPDIIKSVTAPVLKALAEKDMKDLVKATEGLNDGLRASILTLADTGKTAEAQKVFLEGLAKAAGSGPNGLTKATNELGDSWDQLKVSMGQDIAGPATTAINWLRDRLKELRGDIETTQFSWSQMFKDAAATAWSPLGSMMLRDGRPFGREAKGSEQRIDLEEARRQTAARDATNPWYGKQPWYAGGADAKAAAIVKGFEDKYGSGSSSSTTRSAAQVLADFEAELSKRGVRVIDDVRSAATQNKYFRQGLTPLDGYQNPSRHQSSQAVDVDKRTHSDAKAYEAAQAAGLKGFEIVTESGGRKHYEWTGAGKPGEIDVGGADSRRDAAARKAEQQERAAERAREEAIRRQRDFDMQSATLDSQLLELKGDSLTDVGEIAQFQRQQVKVEADKTRAGIDAKQKLGDYTAAQAEILREKVGQIEAERTLRVNTAEAAAKSAERLNDELGMIDRQRAMLEGQEALALTSAQRKDLQLRLLDLDEQEERLRLQQIIDLAKIGEATAQQAKDAQRGLDSLNETHGLRARAIERGNAGPAGRYLQDTDPAETSERVEGIVMDELLAVKSGINDGISSALGIQNTALSRMLDIFLDEVLFRPIAEALQARSGGGGGGGGLLGTLLGLGTSMFGGGGPSASLVADAAGTIAANPALFASGTPGVPVGRDFYVGENGREKMRYHGGGRLEVISGARTRREAPAAGGFTLVQNNYIPERSDPRRTQSGIARANQRSMMQAARKGLAVPGGLG